MDEVVPEPLGGAHRDPAAMVATMQGDVLRHLGELTAMDTETRLAARYAKLRALGNGLAPLEPLAAPTEIAARQGNVVVTDCRYNGL